jgi:hypothetical protein
MATKDGNVSHSVFLIANMDDDSSAR